MRGPPEYSIALIVENDTERVISFLNRSFFCEEPLLDGLGINGQSTELFKDYDDKWTSIIHQGISFKAVDSFGDIIGVRLNTILTRGQNSERSIENEKSIERIHSTIRECFRLMDKVYWESNVFDMFPEVDKVLSFSGLVVKPEYRAQGIGKALVERSVLLAEERGIPLIRVTCSNAYSSRAMARLGFDLVYSLPYSEYLDADGHPVFTPSAPHTDIQVFVKFLRDK